MTDAFDAADAALERDAKEAVDLPALIVALRASQGNIAQAAAMLGISRQRAYRLMRGQTVDLDALRAGDPEEGDVESSR
jgi:transcriptional regulator of acetoin/glycerol metabolism